MGHIGGQFGWHSCCASPLAHLAVARTCPIWGTLKGRTSRGCGEGGTILAPAALTNAVEDAIVCAGGAPVVKTPLTPTHVLELLGTIPADT